MGNSSRCSIFFVCDNGNKVKQTCYPLENAYVCIDCAVLFFAVYLTDNKKNPGKAE